MGRVKKWTAVLMAMAVVMQPMSVWAEDAADPGLFVEDVDDGEAGGRELLEMPQGAEAEEPQVIPEVGGAPAGAEAFSSGEDETPEAELFGSGDSLEEEAAVLIVEEELSSPLIVTLEDSVRPRFRIFSLEQYEGSYGDQLEGNARIIYDELVRRYVKEYMLDHANGLAVNIEIGKIEFAGDASEDNQEWQEAKRMLRESVQSAIDAFSYDYPQVFWMRAGSYSYAISSYPSNNQLSWISSVTFTPQVVYGDVRDDDGAKVKMMELLVGVDRAVGEIQGKLTDSSTLYEKVKAIEEYICENASYGADEGAGEYEPHCAGPLFVGGKNFVCEGYAKSMKILCDEMGVVCACVSGRAASRENEAGEAHMWNYVQMENGSWYLVDATWDDQTTKRTDYLLAGESSVGMNGLTIREERTLKNTFSSPMGYDAKEFTYPVLSEKSYLEEREEAPVPSVAPEPDAEPAPSATPEPDAEPAPSVTPEPDAEPAPSVTPEPDAEPAPSVTPEPDAESMPSVAPGTNVEPVPDVTLAPTAAPQVQTEPVPEPFVELNAKALRLRRGQSYKLRVTRMNVGDRVKSFTSSKKGVASVDKRGRVTGKKAGKAVITVILESGARATVSVTVRGGTVRTKKITVQKKSVTLKPRKTFQIKAKVTPASSTQKVTYQSSNKKVATVTKKGKIRARKKGSAVITVKSGTKKVKVKVRVK